MAHSAQVVMIPGTCSVGSLLLLFPLPAPPPTASSLTLCQINKEDDTVSSKKNLEYGHHCLGKYEETLSMAPEA